MKTSTFIKDVIATIIISVIIGVVFHYITKVDAKNSSFLKPYKNSFFYQILPDESSRSEELKLAVDNALLGTEGTYGIVIKNLKTDEGYAINEHKVFEPASLYKLWVMAAVFKQIQEGKLKEDQVLSEDIKTLNAKFDIDQENAELKDGGITLTVKQALEQMITISHNYAALLLADQVKLSSISDFLESNRLRESEVGSPPKSTPSDIALFYEKLYKGELADPSRTQQMIDLLKRQKLNDKLPKGLPNGVTIAHKTGEIGGYSHDAGIVYTPKGDYLIIVLSESNYPPGAEERIGQISKAVYEYMMKGS